MSPPSVNDDVSTSDYPSHEYVDAAIAPPTLFTGAKQHPATDAEHQPLLGQSVRVKYRSGSRAEALVVVVCIACTTGVSSLLNGHVIVALPMMADDLGLSVDLVLWSVPAPPVSPSLACSSSCAVTDATSSRLMFLLGCFLQCLFTSACGFAQTGTQLIVFRALSGVAASFCLPASVSIIYDTFPAGPWRNAAFASMGGGQPVGYGVGLVLGGILTSTAGWPWGFHVVALTNSIVLVLAAWQLPVNSDSAPPVSWRRLAFGIDWIGAFIASISLALLSYILAVITGDTSNIRNPTNICLLGLSLALMPAFVAWVHHQEHNDRPALIPNSLWSNKGFTSICINVFLMWGAFNAFEQVLNLVYQKVKGLDAFATALAFLPMPISGLLAYPAIGLVVHRIRADWIVLATTVASCVSPLLMALSGPSWSYWVGAFPALLLNATASDSLFTISNLLIMSVFPGNTQGLAGGVFSTIAQIGKSMGLAVVALIAESITTHSSIEDKESPEALMEGYRAAFWFLFALSAASFFVSFWGLHGIGKVGRAAAA
ncbi:MAG: hypothetical protein Q9172_005941 [Xanthocarpia lactea]